MLKFKQFLNETISDKYFSILRKRQFMTTRKDAEELGVHPEQQDAHESDLTAWDKISQKLYNSNLKIGDRESTNVANRSYGSVYDKLMFGGKKEYLDRMRDIKDFRKSKGIEIWTNYIYGLHSGKLSEIASLSSPAKEEFRKRVIKDRPQTSNVYWYEKTMEAVKNIKSVTGR